jgi:flagellar biosynthesis chaperone FliJ
MRGDGRRLQRLQRLAAARQREQAERLRAARRQEEAMRREAARARAEAEQHLDRSRATDLGTDIGVWVAERHALLRARLAAQQSAVRLQGAQGEAERCRSVYVQVRGEVEALRRLSLRRDVAWRQQRANDERRILDDLTAVRRARAEGEGRR